MNKKWWKLNKKTMIRLKKSKNKIKRASNNDLVKGNEKKWINECKRTKLNKIYQCIWMNDWIRIKWWK